MSDSLSFEKAQEAIPELTDLNEDIEVVIIGYHECPYSKKALAAKNRVKKWSGQSGKVLFVGYDFGGTGAFKQTSRYRGSFPIVYVKQTDGEFKHVGGGEDFERYVSKMDSAKHSIIL
jgi:hypothetical protein